MVRSIINVDGMSCEHCVKAITKAVGALHGVSDAAVDLNAKTVMVEHDPTLTVDKIKYEIEEQGYEVIS
ncbi:copper ion binding protein [Stenoxybacter acetivorans]|uniref:copper ion binding protein n=1 Tax=Stenoxybacter acetivorans TaxID=422441 RepID=UPI00056241D1|nr:copper ion binding protein [Stenoxybacter acetivorans]